MFIGPRTIGVDSKSDSQRSRPDFVQTSSRRTSLANRSTRDYEDPLSEVRKRLTALEPSARTHEVAPTEIPIHLHDDSYSESAISSSLDLAAMSRSGKKVDGKAAAAVASTPTNAIGTTSIYNDLPSIRNTPVLNAGPILVAAAMPYSSSYEGKDPSIRAFLEQVDLENYREPLLDFGPRISGSARKRGERQKVASTQATTLIAQFTQHVGGISSIVSSPDQTFFATSSADGQVLIWDVAKVERSVSSKARLAYRMDSRVVAMCRIELTHCLAVAAENGKVEILRVHLTSNGPSPKYGRIDCVRSWRAQETDGHAKFVFHLRGKSQPKATLM